MITDWPRAGDGVDQRRKTAIKRAFGDPWLFRNIIREACDTFKEDAVKMEADMAAAGSECLRAIQSTFDLVRTENALRESEQVPQMRDLVEEVAQDAWDTIEESARVVNGE